MRSELTQLSYCLELTIFQFMNLMEFDYSTIVYPKLSELGADKIVYDKHFGPYVFFTVDAENSDNVVQQIEDFIFSLASLAK